MFESSKCRVNLLAKPENPVERAVASSPGLRSVGWGALEKLIQRLKPTLAAEIFSEDFPTRHDTSPSYFARPEAYGIAGLLVYHGEASFPKVKIYTSQCGLIVQGYHANFYGQYEVAEATVELLKDFGVKRIYVLAGYALEEGGPVCCAASTLSLLKEAEAYGLKPGYVGPFLGFSGLLAGLASNQGVEVLCLFGKTKPKPEEPESPDPEASQKLYEKLCEILKVHL